MAQIRVLPETTVNRIAAVPLKPETTRQQAREAMRQYIDAATEEEFKQHLAALMDEPMIQEPTSLDEHSSGEGGMDQPARKQIDPTKEEPTA